MLAKKYRAQVSKRHRKILLRSFATEVSQQLTDLQSMEARDVITQLSIARLGICRPGIDAARSTKVFVERGTDTVVSDPTDRRYKAGDIEPLLIVYVKDLN